MTASSDIVRRALGEFVGTAFLLAAIVGSGITAETLTDDVGLQLLQNAIATGAVLVALILAFSAVSGAHFNPVVTITERVIGGIDTTTALVYMSAQILGAAVGSMAANLMFDLDLIALSTKERDGLNLAFAEGVATLGLLLVIFGVVRSHRTPLVAFAVGGYIVGAFAFTSSTSFANPAVTLARALSDTFAGIAPGSIVPFIAAQLAATVVAVVLIRVFYPTDVNDNEILTAVEVSANEA